MVKLIALDLDRTTLTSDGHLSEANKRALSGAIKRGVHVCIASGRAFDTLPEEVHPERCLCRCRAVPAGR